MSRPVLDKDTFHFSVTLLARLKIRGIYSNYHRSFVVAIVQSEKAREDWTITIFKFNCSKQQIKDNYCSNDCEFSSLMICS